MSDAVPDLSAMCTRSDHGRCPHTVGVRLSRPWRRSPVVEMRVCSCPCHAGCPVATERTVTQEAWAQMCTCPGGARQRASYERQKERRRILADVDFSDHPDAEEIGVRLRAVFEEHREAAPPGLTVWSRVVARGSARPSTRSGYRAAGVVTGVATLLTAAAVASTGSRRLAWGVAAGAAWLLSGYAVTLVTVVAQVSRAAEAHPRPHDLPSR